MTCAGPMGPDQGPDDARRYGRDDDPAAVVDAVARAVLAVDGVAGLHPGTFGEVATHLPQRRVRGIRVHGDGSAEVHVIIRWGAPALATAAKVRRAASALLGGRVDVTIGDVVAGNEPGARDFD